MKDKPPFSSWWRRLKILALDKGFELGERFTYREYYDDGDEPETVLEIEMGKVGGKK